MVKALRDACVGCFSVVLLLQASLGAVLAVGSALCGSGLFIAVCVFLSRGPGPSAALYSAETTFIVLCVVSLLLAFPILLAVGLAPLSRETRQCLLGSVFSLESFRAMGELLRLVAAATLLAQAYPISRQAPFAAPPPAANATAAGVAPSGNGTAALPASGPPPGWPTAEGVSMAGTLVAFGATAFALGLAGLTCIGVAAAEAECLKAQAAAQELTDVETPRQAARAEDVSG